MIQARPEPSLARLVLLKRLVYMALGKTVYKIGTVPAADATWWHVSQFDSVVVTDASQEGVRIRTKDRKLTISLARRLARVVRRLIADLPRLREQYRAAVPELTSKDNWKRLYRL